MVLAPVPGRAGRVERQKRKPSQSRDPGAINWPRRCTAAARKSYPPKEKASISFAGRHSIKLDRCSPGGPRRETRVSPLRGTRVISSSTRARKGRSNSNPSWMGDHQFWGILASLIRSPMIRQWNSNQDKRPGAIRVVPRLRLLG